MALPGFLARLFGSGARVPLERRYERLQEGVSGTMSQFYKARDHETGAIVGLKIIDPKKLEPIEGRYKGLGKPSEGEIGRQITGPNVVKTLAWGTSSDGRPFVVQEFVEGILLHTLLSARKPLSSARRLDLVRQGAAAVAIVHRAGFVHRDVCPRNYILRPDGTLVLIDFGLTVPDKPVFLQPGNRIGTPNYMAPEVVRRRQADKRLDIFSFGVTAYEICTYELPWPRGSSGKAALAHDSPPDDIRGHWPDIPRPLAEAIMACVSPDPAQRPESLDAFLTRIKGVALDAAAGGS